MSAIEIGTWHEKEERKLTQHTEYAADYIIHETIPGDYPARLSINYGGFVIPMPHWLLVGIDSNIIDGRLYSGFCGINFAHRDVERRPSEYTIQADSYHIPEMVKTERLTLKPEWEFLNQDTRDVIEHIKANGLPTD